MTPAAGTITHGTGTRFAGSAGRIYTLGAYRCRGGEGFIYDLDRQPGHLAKIYAEEKPPRHRDKLETLAAITDQRVRRIAALPEDVLTDATGRLAGFVMPEVRHARPLHELVSPVDRLRYFPHLSYKNLVMIAANIARVMGASHAAGLVIADVNPRNLLVAGNGISHLVDCDSVQIGDGHRHRCTVAMEEFLAPELHGTRLDRLPRTREHDAFALAVIVFQLLIAGRHPHTGQLYRGAFLDIPAAIRTYRHVLDSTRTDTLFPQLGIAPTDVLSPAMIGAFRSAFGWSPWHKRPSPDRWLALLEQHHDALTPCTINARHQFSAGATTCPWCAIEQRHGALFPPAPARAPVPPKPRPRPLSASRSPRLGQAIRLLVRNAVRGLGILLADRAMDLAWATWSTVRRRPLRTLIALGLVWLVVAAFRPPPPPSPAPQHASTKEHVPTPLPVDPATPRPKRQPTR